MEFKIIINLFCIFARLGAISNIMFGMMEDVYFD
jgi:hypothetical protein